MVVQDKNITESMRNMWIMMLGAFTIILCNTFDYLVKDTPAFIFVTVIYFFMGFFIFIIYNPFRGIKKWMKK